MEDIEGRAMMLKNIRILIVDDFSTMRRLIKKILTDLGADDVIEAENGSNAWDILSREKINLVICDWNMPNMSGMELLEKVRADETLADIPFIMVTAEGKKDNVTAATKKGVTGYVTKPFNAESLRSKIKTMFANAAAEK
jgi:two-component system chemotaxis response regulator CheY